MLNIFFPILLLLLPTSRTPRGHNGMIMMITTFISFFYLYQPLLSSSIISYLLFFDPLSSSLISLVLWISSLMLLASPSSSKFNLCVSSLCFALILSFAVSNFINFYITFESTLIPTLLLIICWGTQPERTQASFYLIMYTITASLPLLLSLTLTLSMSGHLSMHLLYLSPPHIFPPPMNLLWWSMTFLAFLVKMPLYFLHLWLPKAHVEAPLAGSMILAGVLLKLGGYGILRLSPLSPSLMSTMSPFWNSISLWGGVITSFICLRQSDIKSLIAYSSIGHMSLVIMGSSLMSSWGWQGALTMMIAHGLCSSCLFLLANSIYEITHTRSIFLTKGILHLTPSISLWWFFLSIMNMAAPPSINLFAEINLLLSALWASLTYMLPLMIISFMTAAYSLHLYSSINHGPPPQIYNPFINPPLKTHSLCLFHFSPIIILILKPEIISSWI
uniref:NADH-ubiquinone oxidoreductase chain 4 n=1 Tax=Pelagomacellicephala iliffei TaxID=1960706 RepID=A0A8E7MIJ4_9ANNE|nr:NADH dehydrogenase subunit 4 [Pelagomacellicephala iliffei]